MSKQKIESVIIEQANLIGLALLTKKRICELAGVKEGAYFRIMQELFTVTLNRMEVDGLPRYIAGVGIASHPGRVSAETRKELILEAALRLCKVTLWALITREEIAKEAGVSEALITYHFGTMPELRANLAFEAKRHGIPLIPEEVGE